LRKRSANSSRASFPGRRDPEALDTWSAEGKGDSERPEKSDIETLRAERTDAVDRAGILAVRGLKSLQPARQRIFAFGSEAYSRRIFFTARSIVVARKAEAPKSKPRPCLAQPGDRFEVSFFDRDTLNLSQAPGGGISPDYSGCNIRSLESVTAFARQGLYMPLMFYSDDGYTARFLLGDANDQEAAEWIGRVVWKLDLRSGTMGCEELAIDVPPGEYLVEVCLYLPHGSAGEILDLVEKDHESVWDYWMRTRPGRKLPGWLLEDVTCQEEEVVPEELLPEGDETDAFVDVLVRLAPLPAKLKMPGIGQHGLCRNARLNAQKKLSKELLRLLKDSPCRFLWEGRKPKLCPFGIHCVNVISFDRP
jgi:hypothetical protein